MGWDKVGRIFVASGQRPWMHSHTSKPIVLHLTGSVFRVFFSTRDSGQHSYIGYLDISLDAPDRVLDLASAPILSRGPAGFFDDNGVYPAWVLENEGRIRMYYAGRINGTPPLWYMAVGVAVSQDGGESFTRLLNHPAMDRGPHDPWMVTSPCVLREGGVWRMWYTSGSGWDLRGPNATSFYDVKYAESEDGIRWNRKGLVAIDCREDETNTASPSVLRNDSGYRMWYSYVKKNPYRIGYAESDDGLTWERRDEEVGISLSSSGWDSEMMAYPHVFSFDGTDFMLYSGNGNGRAGIGLAISS